MNQGLPTGDLPSLRQLNRATLGAAAAAAVILVVAVLPAEYGVDPIGAGRLLGLTKMGEVKQAQAGGGDAPAATATAAAPGQPVITDLASGGTEVRLTLRPYGGKEVKAWMKAGEQISYDWSTEDGTPVEFEFHGDAEGAAEDDYTSYEKATKPSAQGNFKAGFTGRHGWYWKNLTPKQVTITARVKGQYEKFAPL